MRLSLCLALALAGCDPTTPALDAPSMSLDTAALDIGALDSGAEVDAPPLDAPTSDAPSLDAPSFDAPATATLTACPTTGADGIHAPAGCFVFTPEDAGAPAGGVNGDVVHYALEPSGTARGIVVVHMSGSRGTPAGAVIDPDVNVYTVLAEAGFHVIGLSYRSAAIVGMVCAGETSCFGPTRLALLTGEHQAGEASTGLSGLRVDEGIVPRLDAALAHLVAGSPGHGWEAFRTSGAAPADRIAWGSVITSGHSQGGGHAAYLGRLFPVRRVVQLSSTCDGVDGVAAAWTAERSAFVTSPSASFVGFAAMDDTVLCPFHAAVWEAMGLDASRRFDDATVCATGGGAHGATIACAENLMRLPGMFAD